MAHVATWIGEAVQVAVRCPEVCTTTSHARDPKALTVPHMARVARAEAVPLA